MKNLRKVVLLTLCSILMFTTTALAEGTGSGNGQGFGGGNGEDNYRDGVSEAKTGYLLYLTDANGNLVSSVKAITTVAGVAPPSMAAVKLSYVKDPLSVMGDIKIDSTTGAPWGFAPGFLQKYHF